MTFTTEQYKTSDGKYAKLFNIELNKYNRLWLAKGFGLQIAKSVVWV